MLGTMREKKNKEVFQNGTAFRSFAIFDEPNPSHREYMEDCTYLSTQSPFYMTASSKIAPSLPSSASLMGTAVRMSVDIW
jgi:hypothetical protein